jgi:hypothetical protein
MNSADVQDAVATEVNDRLAKATADLAEKYARGKGGVEDSVSAPTGAAYKEVYAQEQKEQKQKAKENEAKRSAQSQKNQMSASEMDVGNEGANEDEDDGDEDYELRRIKEQRLRQIKDSHRTKLENAGKGHGQFREVLQDEFLNEVTSSTTVICQFFHRDFPRCEIMSHHLSKLAPRHIESKFIKINAEKAPFFVEKVFQPPIACLLSPRSRFLIEFFTFMFCS